MRTAVLSIIAAFTAFASQAEARGLCVDKEFTENLRFKIDVGWDKPNPLDPNPTPVTPTPDKEKILTALQAMDEGWRTPSSIWPQSAVTITFVDNGITQCQAIYTREEIYMQDDALNGFVVRKLPIVEYNALNDALGI